MAGGLMTLISRGTENVILNGNPKKTFFKATYNKYTNFGMQRTAPENIKIQNPAFDVTPNDLVTGLITDKGIVGPPYKENRQNKYL